MKDYKLSEIKAICKKQKGCEKCPLTADKGCYGVCKFSPAGTTPLSWEFDEDGQSEIVKRRGRRPKS